MGELDYDLSKNIRKQLTPKMVEEADRIIVMTEKENLPNYVDASKITLWNIEDAKDRSLEFHHQIMDQIKVLIEKLIKEIR